MNKKYIKLFAILSLYNNINTGMMGEIFNPRTRSFAAKEMSNRFFGRNQNVSHLTYVPQNNFSAYAYIGDNDITNKTVMNELLDDKSLAFDSLEEKLKYFKELLENNPQLESNHKDIVNLLENLNLKKMLGNNKKNFKHVDEKIIDITANMPLRKLFSPFVEESFRRSNSNKLYTKIIKLRLQALPEQDNSTMISLEEYVKHPKERIWYTKSADSYLLNQEKHNLEFSKLGIKNPAQLTPSLKATLTNYGQTNYLTQLNGTDINDIVKEYTNVIDGYRYEYWDANKIKSRYPIFNLLASITDHLTKFDVKYQDGDYELFRSAHGFASERAFGDFLKNYINVKKFPKNMSNIEKLELAMRDFLDLTIKESKILGDLKSTRKD